MGKCRVARLPKLKTYHKLDHQNIYNTSDYSHKIKKIPALFKITLKYEKEIREIRILDLVQFTIKCSW